MYQAADMAKLHQKVVCCNSYLKVMLDMSTLREMLYSLYTQLNQQFLLVNIIIEIWKDMKRPR